jgi:DNA-binding response OmpR family regulator
MTKPRSKSSVSPDEHLLVVDSDDNESYFLAVLLQRIGYRVCTVKTAAQALESMAMSLPALVLTTHTLPDISGEVLIERLNQDPGMADVPVIVLAGADDVGAEKHVLDAGAAAYLTKPVRTEDLYRAVQTTIESTPRKNIRIRTRLPIIIDGVELDYEGGEYVSMLSERGMHVRTHMPRQQKRQHSVLIRIHDRVISLIAEVLYRQEHSDTPLPEPGTGFKFVQISPKDRQYLKQYVLEEVTKGIS